MTISSTTNRVSYTGNGATTAFSFPYYFQSTSDLVVLKVLISDGTETTQVITTDYTVSGTTLNNIYPSGGTINMLAAPSSLYKIVIYRDPALTQTIDFVENDALPAETLEQGLDKAAMQIQRLSDLVTRSITLPEGYTGSFDASLPGTLAPDTSLVINSTGTGFTTGPTITDLLAAEALATAAAASAAAAAASAASIGTVVTTFDIPLTIAELATPATPASGYGKIYFKSDGFMYQLNDSGAETKVGSGGFGINYLDSNSDAESGVTGYTTYNDAAATSPVDMTGGSPVVTFTKNTSSPLRGTADFLLTKGATNRQGDGVAYAMTIASADTYKMLQISFEYKTSASYADNDVRVYVYDVTNSTLIEPINTDIKANAVSGKHYAYFQTTSSTSYRVGFHVSSTNASAYTVNFDTIVVGPNQLAKGAIVSDWTSYTPTVSGLGTVTSVSTYYRRVGDTLLVRGRFVTGTTAASTCSLTLPSGLAIDTTKVPNVANGEYQGTWVMQNSTANTQMYPTAGNAGVLFFDGSTNNTLFFAYRTGSVAFQKENGVTIFGNNIGVVFEFQVPISGWSSSINVASESSNSVIAFKGYNTGGQTISTTSATTVQYNTVESDTAGGFNTGTYTYTIPESGYYFLSASYLLGSYITEEKNTIRILRNGTAIIIEEGSTTGTAWVSSANGIKLCNKGDTITVSSTSQTDSSYTIDASQSATALHIFKIQGNQTIGYDEVVACIAEHTAGQSISTATITQVTNLNALYDSHGALVASVYTVPVSGLYDINWKFLLNTSTAWSITESCESSIRVGGVSKASSSYSLPATSGSAIAVGSQVSYLANLVKGQQIDVTAYQSSGSSIALLTTAGYNQLIIKRIK